MEKLLSPAGVIEFDPLSYNDENLIKININNNGQANGEGIWAVVSPIDMEKHDGGANGQYFVAMCANSPLKFLPINGWGMHIVAQFRGDNRPVCSIEWVDYTKKENRIWSNDVPEEMKV